MVAVDESGVVYGDVGARGRAMWEIEPSYPSASQATCEEKSV